MQARVFTEVAVENGQPVDVIERNGGGQVLPLRDAPNGLFLTEADRPFLALQQVRFMIISFRCKHSRCSRCAFAFA